MKVITHITEPTDWLNNIVVATKKDGNVRICLDLRPLNKGLKREMNQLPILDDILPELTKAKVFACVDLKSAYWHCILDDEISLLTTFQAGKTRYRWLRLPFGTSPSSEIFCRKLRENLEGLKQTYAIADDIMMTGIGDTIDDAKRNLYDVTMNLLERCREVGIKLNPEKMKINLECIPFMGHLVTCQGLKPDPKKVEAVMHMTQPVSPEDISRFQGFVNYLARFLPSISQMMKPLRCLLRKDIPFVWSTTHQNAFEKIKQAVCDAPVLAYYDPQKQLVIQCDASDKGLGAALIQDDRPLAYASRALTDTESRYAQIEKELLAIVYSMEKFHQYTFGNKVIVRSDHKPLESIMKKTLHSAPRRLQNMMLRLQKYDVEVEYLKGKEMYLADTLSRAYLPDTTDRYSDEFASVHMAKYLPVSEMRLEKIKRETAKDEVLQILKQTVLQGWPDEKREVHTLVCPYFHARDEMTVQDCLLFRGERIIIPSSMKSEIKERLHSGHMGVDSILRRARDCIYWPNMNTDIRDMAKECETCLQFSKSNQRETLMSHELPSRPWEKVGSDIFTLHDKNYLILVDYYSNFIEVDKLENLMSKTVIKKLKAHYARYGIPNTLISDNGLQYASKELKHFAET